MDYPEVGVPIPVDELDPSTDPVKPGWIPRYVIDFGKDDQAGIAFDDGCMLVLFKDVAGYWRPGKWIPVEVARRLHEFA